MKPVPGPRPAKPNTWIPTWPTASTAPQRSCRGTVLIREEPVRPGSSSLFVALCSAGIFSMHVPIDVSLCTRTIWLFFQPHLDLHSKHSKWAAFEQLRSALSGILLHVADLHQLTGAANGHQARHSRLVGLQILLADVE